jgi:hypothetical protein
LPEFFPVSVRLVAHSQQPEPATSSRARQGAGGRPGSKMGRRRGYVPAAGVERAVEGEGDEDRELDEGGPLRSSSSVFEPSAQEVAEERAREEWRQARLPREPWCSCFIARRAVLAVLGHLMWAICYADRTNISIAILPMAEEKGWDKSAQGVVLSSFFWGYVSTQVTERMHASCHCYARGEEVGGSFCRACGGGGCCCCSACCMVVAAAPLSHAPSSSSSQVLGGWLALRFGGKPVLAAAVAVWSTSTLLTPLATDASYVVLLASRVVMGFGEGMALPCLHHLTARWVPLTERSTFLAFTATGERATTSPR